LAKNSDPVERSDRREHLNSASTAGSALSVGSGAAIFLVALTIRLIHIWQIRRAPFFTILMGDSHGYDVWAQEIAKGDWIGHDVFYQAPLYPYFLGVIYATIGRSLLAVRMCQAVIGSCSCVLLASAAARFFSPRVGLVAGLMLALYAPAIFFDGLLQKSVLDVFFVCLMLWLLAKVAEQEDSLRARRTLRFHSFVLGLALGGLSLTRENALVFIVVVLAWILVTVRDRAKAMGAFAAGLAIVLVPVAARNSLIGGGFYVTTSQFGPNFFIGNHPGADGTYQSLRYGRGAPEYERQDAADLAEHALHRKLTPGEVSQYWTDRALDFITWQPAEWMKLMARKIALVWNATEMVDTEDQSTHADWSWPLWITSPIGHFGVLVPLAVLGAIVTWPDRRRLAVLYALILAYAASVVLFYVFARYRYPLVPLLVLFAAAGALGIWDSGSGIRGIRAIRPNPGRIPNPKSQIPVLRIPNPKSQIPVVVAVAIFVNWPIESQAAMRAVTETNLGVALQGDRKLDEAIAHYRRAIAARPDYAPAYSNLATALRDAKRLDEAVATYQQALKLQPEFAAAHYNFANLLLDEGDAAAAADHFQRALRTEPASAEVHNNLGIALAGLGKVDDAIAEFRQAIELDPKSARAYRNLGDGLSTAGRQAEAIDALRHAAGLDPNDAANRYDLASALLEAGMLDEAVAEFRATVKLAPNFVEAHNNLGIALGSQGKLDEAIGEFQQALKLDPGFADAKKNLSTALTAKRQIK
jgi:tetratricopeptide (TPR) repeat protein/4-amino-4-deoxy-L-arabinose transferase-like glycosyltransferase